MKCWRGYLGAKKSGLQLVKALGFCWLDLQPDPCYRSDLNIYFTGELLVGPSRVLFMDEISNGLDSSTTYQIIKYLRHSTHALDGTTVISLLQPAPETYELFDDIILLSEGHIVYQGPREEALDFFACLGFQCPQRKNVADFLQEVSHCRFFRMGILFLLQFLLNLYNKYVRRLCQGRTSSSTGMFLIALIDTYQ